MSTGFFFLSTGNHISLQATIFTPVSSTFSRRISPHLTGLSTEILLISSITSKIFSFGILPLVLTGILGWRPPLISTVEEMVLMGWVSSPIAYSFPWGQLKPFAVSSGLSVSRVTRQPLGQQIQVMVLSSILHPP